MRCACCDKLSYDLIKTAYGDYLCEDCWDDYICTGAGRLEYFIGICNRDYPIEEFDADFLCGAVKSWKANRNVLDFTHQQKFELEEKARELGLL